ncbi:MAG: Do family serine endopeptidase [Saprospiraceae bacterium]|jgi:Do/DeqQ family serine protease|nr:Do family serine endopeptidase [Saprospiraceae bacterium]MBK8295952.1 Do family serine endopeptidase [Saprospiraceae bacterium]
MNSIRTQSSIIFICLAVSILSSYLTFKFLIPRIENSNEVKLIHEVNDDPNDHSALIKSSPIRFLNTPGTNFVFAASKSTPSVVFIESMIDSKEGIFSMPNKELSTGSGVIISPDGYIITNNHVVENAEKIQVLLNDNREYEAKLIGTDPTTDIALIKIEDSSLPYIEFGNSDSSEIGEWVLAVGNPFRLQSTVTAGIISAKARNINILNNQQYRIESFIQTDAAVNPGNSGGALVNTNGDLIGINTAIMSQTGRYEGYSFSIPSNLVKKVFSDLKEFGTVQRGLLGVVIEEVNNERAKLYGLTHVGGVFISNTTRDGAADIAGLKPEDIILELNNRTIKSVPELQEIIGRLRPGSKIQIKYWRNNQTNTVEAILKNQVNTTEMLSTRRDPLLLDLGFEVRDLSAEEKTNLKQSGVKVLSIYQGSIIENTNMAPGYIITTVNGKKVRSVDELIQTIQSADINILLEGFYEKYRGKFPYRFNKKQ